jgi:Ni2+-binding GTPase involved in maturation of urease and hydrogenase
MITVTIEGGVGEGKTQLGHAIVKYARDRGKIVVWKDDTTEAALKALRPDIAIVTKVAR